MKMQAVLSYFHRGNVPLPASLISYLNQLLFLKIGRLIYLTTLYKIKIIIHSLSNGEIETARRYMTCHKSYSK